MCHGAEARNSRQPFHRSTKKRNNRPWFLTIDIVFVAAFVIIIMFVVIVSVATFISSWIKEPNASVCSHVLCLYWCDVSFVQWCYSHYRINNHTVQNECDSIDVHHSRFNQWKQFHWNILANRWMRCDPIKKILCKLMMIGDISNTIFPRLDVSITIWDFGPFFQ